MTFEISSQVFRKLKEAEEIITENNGLEWENKDEENVMENQVLVVLGVLQDLIVEIEERAANDE
jgi:uncharacterized ferredoxin-like protein